jgi:hypothetical protein
VAAPDPPPWADGGRPPEGTWQARTPAHGASGAWGPDATWQPRTPPPHGHVAPERQEA